MCEKYEKKIPFIISLVPAQKSLKNIFEKLPKMKGIRKDLVPCEPVEYLNFECELDYSEYFELQMG